LVDVNVHPRKEEVRFENAFRVYSAVQEAVQHTLEKALSYNSKTSDVGVNETPSSSQNSFADMRNRFGNRGNTSDGLGAARLRDGRPALCLAAGGRRFADA
jgi:DNA mismatch repair ATPase MutL